MSIGSQHQWVGGGINSCQALCQPLGPHKLPTKGKGSMQECSAQHTGLPPAHQRFYVPPLSVSPALSSIHAKNVFTMRLKSQQNLQSEKSR